MLLVLAACSHSQPIPPPGLPSVPPPSPIATLTCARNGEPDMQDYLVYVCWTPGCTPTKDLLPRGPVHQTPVGVTPTLQIDLTGSVGAWAWTARDRYGHESALGNVIRFDRRN
jgi:hypothetical protein